MVRCEWTSLLLGGGEAVSARPRAPRGARGVLGVNKQGGGLIELNKNFLFSRSLRELEIRYILFGTGGGLVGAGGLGMRDFFVPGTSRGIRKERAREREGERERARVGERRFL